MKIKLEINGREYEFSAPLPDDDVRDELEKERYSYSQLAQRYNDRELVVKAQDKRIKELEGEAEKIKGEIDEFRKGALTSEDQIRVDWGATPTSPIPQLSDLFPITKARWDETCKKTVRIYNRNLKLESLLQKVYQVSTRDSTIIIGDSVLAEIKKELNK